MRRESLTRLVVWTSLALFSLLQQPYRTTFDTKLDLTVDPVRFLARSLHLWNDHATFGELQNQAYGYLFPQGPYFLLADVVGVPDWLAQRFWTALLLFLAYEGARGLARALGRGHWAAVLAGLVYALSPRLLGGVGVLSGEVLPSVVLPWMVWPLVLARTRRISARAGGLRSGVAVFAMSGVNAAGTLAMVPAALVLLLWRDRTGRPAGLLRWWVGACALATLWWVVPLLLLGGYSPPFLDFIETSSATTSSTSWANSVRGADHWLGYATVSGYAWWPAAHQLSTTPWLVVAAGVVAAVGLAGLAHRSMPMRGPLLTTAVVGLLCLVAASPATAGSLVDGPVRALLDGPLAPLRNVHKIDPLVRLPLALGFGQAAFLLRRALERRGAARPVRQRRVAVGALAGLLAAAVLAGSWPLVGGSMRMPGWSQVPTAWEQTAAWLEAQPGSRALVVPGTGFGLEDWGWTVDEPIQAATSASWVTRSQVPLAPGPTARVLDALERRVATGVGSEALAPYLARLGVTHVVVRRDLDEEVADTVPAARAEHTLVTSPGLTRVAGFGRSGFGEEHLIDVYRVDGASSSRWSLAPESGVRTLTGAPEDVLTAMEAGALGPDEPVEVGPGDSGGRLVTDGYLRQERQFGRVHDAVSQPMSASDDERLDRTTADYPGAPGVPRATAEYVGGVQVTASSSQGYADVLGPVLPWYGPASALDGDERTMWRSAPFEPAVGQSLSVAADRPAAPGVVQVRFATGDGVATVTRARVTLDGADKVYPVDPDGVLLVPEQGFRRLRLEVVEVAGGTLASQVGVSEVDVPGVERGRTEVLPQPVGGDDTLVLHDDVRPRPCFDLGYGVACDRPDPHRPAGHLDRTFATTADGSWALSGSVGARTDPAAAALLQPVGPYATVTADSVYADDPLVSATFAFDGNPVTPWLADPGTDVATLVMTWKGVRTLRGAAVTPATSGAQDLVVSIASRSGRRVVRPAEGVGGFAPLRARGGVFVQVRRSGGDDDRPLGLGELRLDGLEDLAHAPDAGSRTGALCGLGPEVEVDGVAHRTAVEGTLGDVLRGTDLAWRVCDGPVRLTAGTHRVVVDATPQFEPRTLVWRARGGPSQATGGSPGPTESADTVAWTGTDRRLDVRTTAASVLAVDENTNPGWHAELDGTALAAVTVDGWKQGYVVPAGSDGVVRLVYGPDRWYRAGLLLGLAAVVALLALTVLDALRGGAAPALVRRRPPTADGRLDRLLRRVPRRLRHPALAAVPVAVLGGPVAAVGVLAPLLVGRLRPTGWAVLGAVGVAASGVLSVIADASLVSGRPGAWADGAAALGLGLLLGSVLSDGAGGRKGASACGHG